MKIRYAVGFSGTAVLVAILYSVLVMRPGARIIGVLFPRQVWLVENTGLWALGGWISLLAIFSWMVVVVTLAWSYLPAHRVSSMLQSGLLIISAVLAIGGVVIWMNLLPFSAHQDNANELIPFVDTLALSFLGAGLFMGGAVTAWIGVDLIRLGYLPLAWIAPAVAAGVLVLPAPVLLPQSWYLAVSSLIWCGWCVFLATRREIPSAYSAWL